MHALRDEQRALQGLFEPLHRSGHCRLVFRPDITLEQLFEALQEDRERLVLFHYGGHADADRLMFDSETGESPAFAGGLATLLGQCRGLKVVFLNGCSTGPQVKALLDAGVPAVIATARPIGDVGGAGPGGGVLQGADDGDKERGIDQGQNLLGAFEAAKGFVTTATGANRSALLTCGRDLVGEDVSDLTGMPWDLYPSEPPISVARWTLFDKDPYFGLPGIPEDIPLPPKPFIHLEHFQRKHAPVFFGRGSGDPGALRPDSQSRVTEGDPVLRADRRGQVVGARRGSLAKARANARGGVLPPRREPRTAGDAEKGARGG